MLPPQDKIPPGARITDDNLYFRNLKTFDYNLCYIITNEFEKVLF